jgi:nucleotide-binding universal stress UspA family protein
LIFGETNPFALETRPVYLVKKHTYLRRNKMSYKTILVHVGDPDRSKETVSVAVMMAKRYDAHLIGLYVIPGIQIYPSVAMYIPEEALTPQRKFNLKKARKAQAVFEKLADAEGISAEWRLEESAIPSITEQVVDSCHAADLVILGQPDEEKDDSYLRQLPGDVLMESGRPMMIVPNSGTFKEVGSHVMIGWNGSRESTRAVFDALPMLKMADEVYVHSAVAERPSTDKPVVLGAEIAATLARHDVAVSAETNVNPDISDGDELLSYVTQRGANLLVMGGYGRSRTREMIFGGATNHILKHMVVPVLMSH